jgi:hypothetical protein
VCFVGVQAGKRQTDRLAAPGCTLDRFLLVRLDGWVVDLIRTALLDPHIFADDEVVGGHLSQLGQNAVHGALRISRDQEFRSALSLWATSNNSCKSASSDWALEIGIAPYPRIRAGRLSSKATHIWETSAAKMRRRFFFEG